MATLDRIGLARCQAAQEVSLALLGSGCRGLRFCGDCADGLGGDPTGWDRHHRGWSIERHVLKSPAQVRGGRSSIEIASHVYKKSWRASLVGLCACCLMLTCAVSSFGDGAMFYEPRELVDATAAGRWKLLPEAEQRCEITHQNGRQYLTLAVAPGAGPEDLGRALWLFPVPSVPEEVQISMERSLPDWDGREIVRPARKQTDALAAVLGVVQSPVAALAFVALEIQKVLKACPSPCTPLIVAGDKRIEHHPWATELVSTENAPALAQYAEIRSLSLPSNAVWTLERYMDGKHSFVATWISDHDRLKLERAAWTKSIEDHRIALEVSAAHTVPEVSATYSFAGVGAAVSFPAERLFYPLVPMSLYGSRV